MDKKFSKNADNQDGIFSYFSQVIIADQDLLFSQFDKVGQFGQNRQNRKYGQLDHF